MIDDGNISILPRGEYNPKVLYRPLNVVTYLGETYIAKKNCINKMPTSDIYWKNIFSNLFPDTYLVPIDNDTLIYDTNGKISVNPERINWKPLPYKINYYLDAVVSGEDPVLKETVTYYNKPFEEIDVPIKEYEGFIAESDDTTYIIDPNEEELEINVYYQRESYSITIIQNEHFDINCSNPSPVYGEEVSCIITGMDNGCILDSWSVVADDVEIDLSEIETQLHNNSLSFIMPNANLTISATNKLNTYHISYELDGGTNNANNPTSYTIDTTNLVLYPPNKNKYRFVGWTYADDESSTPETDLEIDTSLAKDIVLIANWELSQHQGSFSLTGNAVCNYDITKVEVKRDNALLKSYSSPTIYTNIEVDEGDTVIIYHNAQIEWYNSEEAYTVNWRGYYYGVKFTVPSLQNENYGTLVIYNNDDYYETFYAPDLNEKHILSINHNTGWCQNITSISPVFATLSIKGTSKQYISNIVVNRPSMSPNGHLSYENVSSYTYNVNDTIELQPYDRVFLEHASNYSWSVNGNSIGTAFRCYFDIPIGITDSGELYINHLSVTDNIDISNSTGWCQNIDSNSIGIDRITLTITTQEDPLRAGIDWPDKYYGSNTHTFTPNKGDLIYICHHNIEERSNRIMKWKIYNGNYTEFDYAWAVKFTVPSSAVGSATINVTSDGDYDIIKILDNSDAGWLKPPGSVTIYKEDGDDEPIFEGPINY